MSKADYNSESDLFNQLLTRYIRQVGAKYESTKAVQDAVKNLEKDLKLSARASSRL